MTFFDVLSLVGGIALFLYGMDVLGKSLEKSSGKPAQKHTVEAYQQHNKGTAARRCRHGSHPIIRGNNGNGCRLCKLGTYAAWAGCRRYYGCKHRNDRHGMDSQPYRHKRQQLFYSASESDELHADSCHHRRCTSNVFKARTQTQHRFGHDRLCRADVRHEYNERKR